MKLFDPRPEQIRIGAVLTYQCYLFCPLAQLSVGCTRMRKLAHRQSALTSLTETAAKMMAQTYAAALPITE